MHDLLNMVIATSLMCLAQAEFRDPLSSCCRMGIIIDRPCTGVTSRHMLVLSGGLTIVQLFALDLVLVHDRAVSSSISQSIYQKSTIAKQFRRQWFLLPQFT